MYKKITKFVIVAVVCVTAGLFIGCETEAQNSALLGSAIGAGVGALAGGDSQGALIGAAVGGGAGYMLGKDSEQKKAQQATQQEMSDIRAEQNTVTVWITNSNGSKTEVKLRRDGPGFRGPRGEYYDSMPTNEQLSVYGM